MDWIISCCYKEAYIALTKEYNVMANSDDVTDTTEYLMQ
jgi:hypothetical protein